MPMTPSPDLLLAASAAAAAVTAVLAYHRRASRACFGRALARSAFPHHPHNHLRLNNGSFGACPEEVQSAATDWRACWLATPDRFWNNSLGRGLQAARSAVAAAFAPSSADQQQLVLVDNLTVASTMVADATLHDCLRDRAPATVLLTTFSYNAVKLAFEAAAERAVAAGVALRLEVVTLPFPAHSAAELEFAFEARLREIAASTPPEQLKMACLDHIASLPCALLPVGRLVAACRAAGFERVFVDGAHAPGQVARLDVATVGADYYAGNVH
eukprot:2196458-Prymnesium_polylepis.1